ncbi:DUF2442 domain-containing protein [Rugamonas sp. CCM 8940]|uniref:DUF2442 domain-containing protein n=1 Tax=Rugamonas sp. CCM 8940 TaxID=2765359 RepID=UPI0018F2F0AF|nr:DUF2442 domain-containing protein [Rugamonas sp. CCM 8940]MBJ7311741.1 DUF2442 domain-containing protein [Rugamonas sp. CCM 8940]
MDLITDAELVAANRRAVTKKATYPTAIAARYDRRIARIVISLNSGLNISFLPRDVQGFEHAQAADLVETEISPSGLGVRFPKIDADIYLPALLEGFLGSRHWMAAQNGRAGGKSSSPAKTAAARNNGKLGGRPKKNKGLAEEA